MKFYYFLYLFILPFTIFSGVGIAQTGESHFGPIPFLENKGQWPQPVLYRGQTGGQEIYLRQDGFTFHLISPEDLKAVEKLYHGNGAIPKDSSGNGGAFIIGPGSPRAAGKRLPFAAGNNTTNRNSPGTAGPIVIHHYAYELNFLQANPHPVIIPDHEATTRYNFFLGNDPSKWAGNVHAFEGVTYKGLYDHVDMRVYSEASRLKYDMIIYPGADPASIRLEYKGAANLILKKNQLYIQTSVGEVMEAQPYAYQYINNEKVIIPCTYDLQGNVISFKVSRQYNNEYPLIIDPIFVFATFTGSLGDNWGYTATYDDAGNFYLGGIIFEPGGYPVTTGAYQTTFGGGPTYAGEGGFDISISKFDPAGRNLLYATYLGGNGNEQPHSLVVDGQGELIVAGRSTSANYPLKPATNQVGTGGGWDIVVTKFNAAGSALVGSIKIGGTGNDGVNIADKYTFPGGASITSLRRFYGDDARSEVNIDGAGNVYLASCTQSSDFPVLNTGIQTTFGGGQQDGVVIKMPPDLNGVLWSTYLGGKGDDAAYVINPNKAGSIYVAGGTGSPDFPVTPGTIQPVYGGGVCDGFITEIANDGSKIIRSTYLGTSSADQIYGIQLDTAQNVYVTGTTEGVWTVTNNAKYPGINVNGKQFISKLQPDLSAYIYSTVFGSSNATPTSQPNISPTAFLVDRCENVYVAGWGGNINPGSPGEYPNAGTYNLPVTPDAGTVGKSSTDGHDFYFFVLKKDAVNILFACFYGQTGGFTDHVDGGTSRFDKTGVIYEAICANCGGAAVFPTGPQGVYSLNNKSGGRCNEVALKVAFNLDGVRGGIATQDRRKIYCNEDSVTFIDTLSGRVAQQWEWSVFSGCGQLPPAGAPVKDTVMPSYSPFTYFFTATGCYTIRLIKFNPGACIEYDTSYVQLQIGDNPANVGFNAIKMLPCDSYKYNFVNTSTNKKALPFSKQAFIWNFGDGSAPDTTDNSSFVHQFPGVGLYTVTLSLIDTAGFCNAPQTIMKQLSISDQLKAGMQVPDTLCAGIAQDVNNLSLGGTNFKWVFVHPYGLAADTVDMDNVSPVAYTFLDSGWYHIILYAYDTVCNKRDSVSDSVMVYPHPTAAFTLTPNKGVNTPITFTNSSKSNFDQVDGRLYYYWDFGDGQTSVEKNPVHLYAESGIFTIRLTVSNPAGCSDTAMAVVNSTIVPALDVPAAFTPNGDGVNDYIAPRAFGVVKIDFRVYNRWGQMVFHSNDPQITYVPQKGWDGKFKGQPQGMDVYAYTLRAVFNDGKTTTRQGSITLIR